MRWVVSGVMSLPVSGYVEAETVREAVGAFKAGMEQNLRVSPDGYDATPPLWTYMDASEAPEDGAQDALLGVVRDE